MNKSLMRRAELVAWHYVMRHLPEGIRYDVWLSIKVTSLVRKFQKAVKKEKYG